VFHAHQREAIEVARSGKSYVLTTGTGSGKSLAYIVPIVDAAYAAVRAAGRTPRRRFADLLIACIAISNALPLYPTDPHDFTGLDRLLTLCPVDRPG